MRIENPTPEEKNTQRMLNKLIAEEKIATDFYYGAIGYVKRDQVKDIHDKFKEIAKDEKKDHLKHLRKFAGEMGFSIPFKYKDMEKYADPECVKLFESMKEDQDADYYVDLAIRSEELAVASYEKEIGEQKKVPGISSILLKNYYDEIEHLHQLTTMKKVLQVGYNWGGVI